MVVIGHGGHLIKARSPKGPTWASTLRFVENTDYLKKNGVSVLAAAAFIDRECVLTMSDHLYSPELVRRLLAAEIPADGAALAVDYDIPRCFDLDDATKVAVERGRIVRIAKELDSTTRSTRACSASARRWWPSCRASPSGTATLR